MYIYIINRPQHATCQPIPSKFEITVTYARKIIVRKILMVLLKNWSKSPGCEHRIVIHSTRYHSAKFLYKNVNLQA
jgi:hypothetical protein